MSTVLELLVWIVSLEGMEGSLVDVCRAEHTARASKKKMWLVGGSQGRSDQKAVQMDGM
jgi:hypothetical protein